MRLFIILLFLSATYKQAFSQLYSERKSWHNYCVEIQNNKVRVEIFRSYPYHFVYTKYDTAFISSEKQSPDTIFSTNEVRMVKRKNKYLLYYKPDNCKKPVRIKMKLSENDFRNQLRNEGYETEKNDYIHKIHDSLAPGVERNTSFRNIIPWEDHHLPDSLFKKKADHLADSILTRIREVYKPIADRYNTMEDSIEFLDTTTVFQLISDANYGYGNTYGDDFLHKLALKKPEYLIHYMEKSPSNKQEVLDAIRDHKNNGAIVKSVKKTFLETNGKKEIVKQKGRRIKYKAEVISVMTLCLAIETAMIAGIIYLIF